MQPFEFSDEVHGVVAPVAGEIALTTGSEGGGEGEHEGECHGALRLA
jgi:hypothetical protein